MVYKYFTTNKQKIYFVLRCLFSCFMMMMKIKGNLCLLVQMKKYYWSKKIQILW